MSRNTKAKANRTLSPVCHFHRRTIDDSFIMDRYTDCVSSFSSCKSIICCHRYKCVHKPYSHIHTYKKMFFLLSYSIVIFTQFLMITFAHRNDMLLSVLNNLETVENEGTPFITIQKDFTLY